MLATFHEVNGRMTVRGYVFGAKEHRPERSDNFLLTPQSKLLKLEKYDLVYDEKRINYFC